MVSADEKKLPSFKILLIFLCLTLVGFFLVPKLPVKLAPKGELPTLTISFAMSGMSARVVEMEVTSKLEAMLSRVKGVQEIASSSENGWGSITVKLNKKANIEAVRFELSTLIRQIYPSLPKSVSYPSVSAQRSDDESARPFLSYTLNAPSSPILIQQYAENNIKHQLAYLPGIDEVTISGATPMIWKLEYDYQQLKSLGITVDDILTAIQRYLKKENLGVGLMENGGTDRCWIRLAITPEKLPDKFDVSNVTVMNVSGKLVKLDELVTVSIIEEEPSGYYRINGLNSIYLSITAKEEANQLQLAKSVRQLLKSMEQQFPPNYEMHLSYDATEYIQEQLNTILFRSGLTILILLGFVLLIYRNRQYLLMIMVSLICSLSLAVVCYYLLKLEIHVYSLMGITISLSLMLDNIIVMADQIHRQKNRKAFLAILTATMTTMAALVMIFFMDEKIRLNLQDFAIVILINLSVSLLVVLFLVPALMEKLHIVRYGKQATLHSKRWKVRFNRFYRKFICFTSRKRGWVLVAGLLLFGLPVFLLPDSIKSEEGEEVSKSAGLYNATLGSPFYQDKMKPVVDVALGGTLRLFIQKVYQGSYWKSNEETSIYVSLSMPNGSTLNQTNFLITKMEDYLRKFPEIRQFQTNVGKRWANIDIRFTKENQNGSFPYSLKNELISKAIEFGGGSWGVYGLGDGFSNSLAEGAGSYRVKLYGYNYDELYAWAETARDSFLQHRRIKEVTIDSRFSYFKNDYQEFIFNLDKERLAEENIHPQALFGELSPLFGTSLNAGNWVTQTGNQPIRLYSKQASSYDIWRLNYFPGQVNDLPYHVSDLAGIGKYQTPQKIARENQQYLLCLQYEYIGAYEQGGRVLDRNVEKIKSRLPLGYSIGKDSDNGWSDKDKNKQYWLLLIVVIIIYFTTSILFNSLRQPLAILLIIPVSFVGLFLTFYLFKLNFDQGGFAAFVLLCGITVNTGIYVVNQYNQLQKAHAMPPLKAYLRAWNFRVVPIFLTILSTVLGFVPFLIGEKEGFWFPLAAGTIGGLVMSMVGLFVFLPTFLGVGRLKKTTIEKV